MNGTMSQISNFSLTMKDGAMHNHIKLCLCVVLMILSIGCATSPYQYGRQIESAKTLKLKPNEPQIERGKPNGFLDAAGWIWPGSLISKLLLWNIKVDSHKVSPDTEAAIKTYLEKNDLKNVKVRINQYSPGAEWQRLVKNRDVGGFWRYTLGALSVSFYTILPRRFFGGDHYNPYTNTIHIYSDHPSIVIHEGGHSKDFSTKASKGGYAAIYMIPFVSLYHEAVATNDALGYMQVACPSEFLKEGYKILYPAYATYIGGSLGQFFNPPLSYAIQAASVIPAHILGRQKASQIED